VLLEVAAWPPSFCTFLIFLEHLLQEVEALPDLLQLLFQVSDQLLMAMLPGLLNQALGGDYLLLSRVRPLLISPSYCHIGRGHIPIKHPF
jgi:hypothetical protein